MPRPTQTRPEREEYLMRIALQVRSRANCVGTRVGALLAIEDRVVATGYNGTPEDMANCDEGGCYRCAHRDDYPSGSSYDLCICVHAEQNALLTAARLGIPIKGATLYTTSRPCFGCTKELLQAGVQAVFYLHDWSHPDEELRHEYEKLQNRIPGGIRRIDIDDPDEKWAIPSRVKSAGEMSGEILESGLRRSGNATASD